ncbi:MAG: ABC transporter permease [Burkholderiales bacterium]|nr:ABC transporter permease [Burkholderiales bacterium]
MPELAARLQGAALAFLPVLIVALAWEAATRFGLFAAGLVPAPSAVAHAAVDLLRGGELVIDAAHSLWRAGAGLALSAGVGIALGVAMARLRPVEQFFQPLVTLTYPIPKSALIPLLMLWLGIGDLSKIAVVFLGTLLPVVMSTYNGVRGIDRMLLWSARNCGTSGLRLVTRIMIPAALPDILAGMRVALALAFVLVVSSEMLVARDGLGHLIMMLGEGGQYPGLFAVALVVGALGFLADRLFLAGMRALLQWREP